MANYDGVIFDLDGTLSDSLGVILKCAQLTQNDLGVPWDEQKQRDLIGVPLYKSAAILCGKEKVDQYIKIFRAYSDVYLEKMIRPFPGVVEMVKKLYDQGVKMTIVTSRLKWGADLSCDSLGLTPYLTAIIGVEDTKNHKPDPQPGLLALEKMGVAADRAVFVGDATGDLLCGKNIGTQTIGVGWGVASQDTLMECQPDYFCHTVEELAKVLCG